MRVAVIGCGNIAQVHAWALKNIEDIQIVAAVDNKIEKAYELSEKYTDGLAAVFDDYRVMMDQIRPDVVHICTPHYWHVPMAVDALGRDISVFMEKPPAISRDEFMQMDKVIDRSKGRLGFCFQNRYNRTTKQLDELVRSGELGEVIGVRGLVTWKRDADYYGDDWHGRLATEGGGVLINQSIHTLDLMLRYMGSPIRISSSMSNHHLQNVIEVEDTLEAWMEFDGGRRASFYATNAYVEDAPVILEIAFSDGRATMLDNTIFVKPAHGAPKVIECAISTEGVGKSYWGQGHLDCISDFYNCLTSDTEYMNDYKGVTNTLDTMMRIYEVARS